ncbi:MAG: hypothetical protein JWM71_2384 [Solirubrobacteraceae bacterium]|nr:hypothetical protein [Solirubrobacteraceae bacterium]
MFEPTIDLMAPRTAAALLAATVTALLPSTAGASRVLRMDPSGHVRASQDRFLPAPDPTMVSHARVSAAATTRTAAQPRTPPALQALLAAGAIDQPTYDRAIADYDRAVQLGKKLTGARRAEIRGVVADLEGMAARGEVVAARLPALLATLEANNRWWATGTLLSPGARIEFSGSDIVWQHYAGHGIQIQWLATFGKANGLYGAKQDTEFGDLLAEAVSLGGQRAGGLAFEYLFPFDGGSPPWVSGLAQGTALTALVRGGSRLKDSEWDDAARSAIGIFRTPPPEGVAQATPLGTHYLQYSFAPNLHILNGFIQSLNGLFDYSSLLNDAEGRQLFAAGEAEAAHELPSYDTGGWSRYSEYRDSDLSYHDLLRGFLQNLCNRLERHQMADEPFCQYAYRFQADLTTPPVMKLVQAKSVPHAKRTARVRFTIDKPGTVTMVISRGSFVYRAVVPVASGAHSFGWKPPRAGSYLVGLTARDLAGNSSAVSTAAAVKR